MEFVQVRRVAVYNLLAMTVDETVKNDLVEVQIPRKLGKLLGDFNVRAALLGVIHCEHQRVIRILLARLVQSIAKDTLKCLVNLSDHPGSLQQLFRGSIVDNIMTTLMVGW